LKFQTKFLPLIWVWGGSERVVKLAQKCKLAHAFLWEYSYKRLQLAQLLGKLAVFLTCVMDASMGVVIGCSISACTPPPMALAAAALRKPPRVVPGFGAGGGAGASFLLGR
jgi:hypothetical protein